MRSMAFDCESLNQATKREPLASLCPQAVQMQSALPRPTAVSHSVGSTSGSKSPRTFLEERNTRLALSGQGEACSLDRSLEDCILSAAQSWQDAQSKTVRVTALFSTTRRIPSPKCDVDDQQGSTDAEQ